MKIIKYKKGSKGKYKLQLENGSELVLYEEVILKFELLLKKEILDEEINSINKYNLECDVYYVALNSIKARFKSVYDTREFLRRKEYPYDLIDKAIDKLIKQGYLNDKSFAKSFINNRTVTTNYGPLKIRKELVDKHISNEIIDEEIKLFSLDEQLDKVKKVCDRLYRTNRNRGGNVLKNKIMSDLYNLGYDKSISSKVISEYDFSNNEDIAKKEYEKLYQRLSRKYEGKELEYKIKEKLYQKGLYYED